MCVFMVSYNLDSAILLVHYILYPGTSGWYIIYQTLSQLFVGVAGMWETLGVTIYSLHVIQVKVHTLFLMSQKLECSNFLSLYFHIQQAHTKYVKICTI